MTEVVKTIGTHSGTFHADEVIGCVMLTKYTKEFKNSKIVRSRDQQILDKLDAQVDVGRVYDPTKHRYDHHQGEFNDTFTENHSIRLSSAGLIYKHFGREVIQNVINDILDSEGLVDIHFNYKELESIYSKMYHQFFMGLDANDNGINAYPHDVKPKYKMFTSFENRIARLNPAWYESNTDPDLRFYEAMKIAEDELIWQIKIVLSQYLAKPYVQKAIESRYEVHESGSIIKLERFCPWKEHIYDIEKEKGIEGKIIYVLFKDALGEWRMQCVSESNSTFTNRKSLKLEWQGKSQEEIAQISGIQDVIFVHANGFIGGAKSYDSILQMGIISLNS